MQVHANAFQSLVTATVGAGTTVGEPDARAILGICALVAGADDKSDADEDSVLGEIAGHLGPPVPNVYAGDDLERLEKIREIGGQLSSQGTRELAYTLAYAVAVADLELAPAESEFLADLAVALGLSDDRAAELAALCAQAVTPPA
ncbi:MAG TPA: hypothetical protein VLT45_26015 [Kofleriaceae bacterium]|nr:hypothetical protein [Kofleriaceae bacterium]